jgi:hypothetical protein
MRAGQLVAMAAIFMAALVTLQAWQQGGAIDAPLILALTYIVVRAVHLALYFYAAVGDRQLRGTLHWPRSACSPRSWRHWSARNISARGKPTRPRPTRSSNRHSG